MTLCSLFPRNYNNPLSALKKVEANIDHVTHD